ncbi:MAG: DEAD/DEAH box helicase, partial [Lentisphaeria bacterium]|nr:DEAD/DEAH box helicase [Lentisphaeria bacterium]
ALNNLVIFGGMAHKGQRDMLLEGQVDILAGTPGRIIDYSRSGDLDLSRVETLVIDEADRMLDMGFIPDVRRIVSQLPPAGKRQTMLFSATLEPSVLRLVESWLRNPVSVESEPEHMVTELIEQRFYAVTSDQKLAMLLAVIKQENPQRMLVFGNRKDHNRTLVQKLYSYGVDAELLSGDVAQEKRLKILEKFRSGAVKVLVATDVAARGIHVDGVTHVVNYDLPEQPDDYVHRIGRTGRAGAKGISISFVCEYGAYVLPDLEQYTKETIRTELPDDAMLVLPEKVRSEAGIRSSLPPRSSAHGGSRNVGQRRNGNGGRRY